MVDFIEIRILGGFRAVPTGLRMDFMRAYPALKRGANYHCAYGAGDSGPSYGLLVWVRPALKRGANYHCAYGAGHRAPLGKLPE